MRDGYRGIFSSIVHWRNKVSNDSSPPTFDCRHRQRNAGQRQSVSLNRNDIQKVFFRPANEPELYFSGLCLSPFLMFLKGRHEPSGSVLYLVDMGEAKGTGAAPAVAMAGKESGSGNVGVVTMPWPLRGESGQNKSREDSRNFRNLVIPTLSSPTNNWLSRPGIFRWNGPLHRPTGPLRCGA